MPYCVCTEFVPVTYVLPADYSLFVEEFRYPLASLPIPVSHTSTGFEKALRVHINQGQSRVVCSPCACMSAGLWLVDERPAEVDV
jgi:hypothetical protein